MTKKIMQDIVKKPRLAKIRRDSLSAEKEKQIEKFIPQRKKEKKENKKKGARKTFFSRKIFFRLTIFVVFILIIFFAVNVFATVKLKITPRQNFVDIDSKLNSAVDGKNLPLEILEIKINKERSAKTTEIKNIDRKASGQIVIYNTYSSKDQGLIKGTRFATPEGKIYKIAKAIVVPGAKIEGGKIIPSLIEVTVYADEPGERFNIGLTDFTIPGFKGGVKYEKFYARSKTKMAGGFSGEVAVVAESDYLNLESLLKEDLKEELLTESRAVIPDGFIFYEGAFVVNFETEQTSAQIGDEAENFNISLLGSLSGFLIRKSDLSATLIEIYAPKATDARLANLGELTFNLLERTKDNSKISFNLKGKGHLVWDVDEESLKRDLIKRDYKQYEEVFRNYPNIERAEIIFKPSWWRRLPSDPSEIGYKEILKLEEN